MTPFSPPASSRRWSGEKATQFTDEAGTLSAAVSRPALFHKRTKPSMPALASKSPLGLKTTPVTVPHCRRRWLPTTAASSFGCQGNRSVSGICAGSSLASEALLAGEAAVLDAAGPSSASMSLALRMPMTPTHRTKIAFTLTLSSAWISHFGHRSATIRTIAFGPP